MTKRSAEQFTTLCRRSFHFLEQDYACRLASVEHDIYGAYVTYTNSTTAVMITYEPREGGIFTRVVRLVGGRLPVYPVSIRNNMKLHTFYLDDIILARNPSAAVRRPPIDTLGDRKVLASVLTQHADALRAYAGDILKGDFTLFPRLEQTVKERAAKLKQL